MRADLLFTDRYNRQELIEKWDQNKLDRTRVVIIGAEQLANYTSVALASLGIGNIEIYDDSKVNGDKEFLLFKARENESKAFALEDILREINPYLHVKGMNFSLDKNPLISIIGEPNIIVDTSNTKESKKIAFDYALRKKILFISACVDESRGQIYIHPTKTINKFECIEEYIGKHQGSTISGIIGGIITEEIRKLIMPLDGNDVVFERLGYSLNDERRFSFDKGDYENIASLKDKKILIVGAGALGNFAALGSALEGIGSIDILDFDEVESTNLNRQILFYDSVGKKKASALAEKVSEIVSGINVRSIVERLDENSKYFEENRPDAILDCVDSFAVRAIVNYFAVRNNIPLISGGTNPKSGQVSVYVPNRSSCLDCKMGVEKALAEHRQAASCRYAPDPSVIMTNQIVGNMMVGETVKVLNPVGNPIKRILKYDSTVPVRGGLIGSDQSCECVKPDVEEWLKEVDKKAKPIETD